MKVIPINNEIKKSDFSKLIKRKRKQKKLSQIELGKLLDISAVYISKIENSHYTPSLKLQTKFLETLEVGVPDKPASTPEDKDGILETLYNELHKIFGKEKGENNVI